MAYLLRDDFVAPNGTALASYAPELGPAWSVAGSWAINGNTLGNTANNGDVVVTQEAGVADVKLQVTLATPAIPWNSGVVVNYVDANNFWLVDVTPHADPNGVSLYEKTGGSYTLRQQSTPSNAFSTTYSVAIQTAGDNIQVTLNGVPRINYTVSSRPHKTGTKIGFRRDSTGGVTSAWSLLLVVDSSPFPQDGGGLGGGAITSAFVNGSPFTGQVLASNADLQAEAVRLWRKLTIGHYPLMLFQSNPGFSPATPLTSFQECDFGGYTRRDTNGKWLAPIQVNPGDYRFQSMVQSWNAPTDAPQNIWGWLLLTPDGQNWLRGEVFPFPLLFAPGANPFELIIQLDWLAWRYVL